MSSTRYQGDLRRDLLDAAVVAVSEQDPAQLSLRAVAREVGVSHAAPKNHFADKTALLTAIAIEGFEGLGGALRRAAADADGFDALSAAGLAYIRWSLAHPGHFRVMWRNELLDQEDPALDRAGSDAFEALLDGIVEAQAHGWAADHDPTVVATAAWSLVHGFAQLQLDGPLEIVEEEDVAALAHGVTTLLVDSLRPASTPPEG